MSHTMYRLTLSAFAVVALATAAPPVHAQQQLNWAEKMFSELKHDFGTVARGADVRHYIVVKNIYKEDIEITNVGTTCGCTAAKPDKKHLKTHEEARIEVQMNTKKFMRRKDSNVDVTLRFNGVHSRTVRIPITAYIRSDVVLAPGNAEFGSVEFGQATTRTIDISYAGRDSWTIKDVRVGNKNLSAEVKQMARGGGRVGYQLVISVRPGAEIGTLNDQIVLVTDDATSPEVPVRVSGLIEPDIVVTPSHFLLGNLKAGEQKTFTVVVKGKRPFSIANIQCGANPDCFEVMKQPQEEKVVHVVPFRVTAPETTGEFKEEFTLEVAGRPVPLKFVADGMIVGS